jgi:hypothetical protein
MAKSKKKKASKKKDSGVLAGVGKDFSGAADLGKSLGLTAPLQQLDVNYSKALMDPTSPAFAGQRSDEMKGIIEMMKNGLAGLNSQENQAIREQGQREVDRQYANTVRDLGRAQRRGNVLGAASAAQTLNAGRQRSEQQSQLEQDLQVRNIDVQDRRRGDFANVLGGQEQQEFGRAAQARNEFYDLSKFNVGQTDKDRAALATTLTGLTGYGLAKQNADRTYKLASKQSSGGGGGGAGYDPSQYINAFAGLLDKKFGNGTSGQV